MSSLSTSLSSSNNSSLKLTNDLSTTLESSNYKQQTIVSNGSSNYNKIKNTNLSTNRYVSNENNVNNVARTNNMQSTFNDNQNSPMGFYIDNNRFV